MQRSLRESVLAIARIQISQPEYLGGSMSSTVIVIVRIILEVLGIIAIGAGIVGGIVTMFKKIAQKGDKEQLSIIGELTAFINALIQLLQALVAAPIWLALVIIGILLVFGSNLLT
jgi:hypothetical protein